MGMENNDYKMELAKLSPKPTIREQVLKHGIKYASDEELLMLILGAGSHNCPLEKLAEKTLLAIETCTEQNLLFELLKIPGMGPGKALCVSAVMEFGRRKNEALKKAIMQPRDLLPFVRKYSERSQEHFLCIALNGAHEILKIQVVAVGGLNMAIIKPREVFGEALKLSAAAVILCHNHPSGKCEPSPEDLVTTENLFQAAKLLGVALLDHLIISGENYFSFLNNGLILQN